MKKLKTLCAAIVLTPVLALSVYAGEITTMVADPPPPPSATEGQLETGIAGEITTMGSEAADDPVMQLAMNVLQSVLSLF